MSFWDTVVMSEAIKLAEENVGPMGRFIEQPELANVGLYTHEAGRFWYGDLNPSTDKDGLQRLAQKMKETVYVIPDMGTLDNRPIHKQAIMDFALEVNTA